MRPGKQDGVERAFRFSGHLARSGMRLVLAYTLLAHVVPARGQTRAEAVHDLNAPVQVGSKITNRKLVDPVFKGVKATESGDLITVNERVLRQFGSKDRTILPGGARLADFPEGSAEPRDMADVQGDRSCWLAETGILLGPDDGFFTENTHSNTGQSYEITDLFQIHGRRLRRIDSTLTLTNRGACEDTEESLIWKTEADSESPYPRLVATITLTRKPSENHWGENCPKPKPPAGKVYSETYRWDKAADRFASVDKGFEPLERFKEQNA
jgi:hypothetical protein